MEERVMNSLPTCVIEGVKGGTDTFTDSIPLEGGFVTDVESGKEYIEVTSKAKAITKNKSVGSTGKCNCMEELLKIENEKLEISDAQSSPRTLASSSPVTQTITSERNDHPVDEYEYAGINLNEEINEQVKVQGQQEQSLVWSRQVTLLLISEYKDRQKRIDAGKLRKNNAFDEISKELNKAGYGFNHEQCNGRMKTITRAYKQVKDHNAKSGNDRKTYEFEIELNELFSIRPNIQPKFVLSTNQEEADHSKDEKKVEQGKRKNNDTDSEGNNSGGKVRKTQASAVISYLETVTQNVNERYEKEQAKKDERHKERMGLFRDLVDALKEKK